MSDEKRGIGKPMGQAIKPAFKFEVAPSAIKRVETIGLPHDRKSFRFLIAASVIVHLLIYFIRPDLFWSENLINTEQSWDVDVDFMGDVTLKAPSDTALPNAVKSEDEAVPKNLLPQLPKKFQVDEQKPIEDSELVAEKDKKAEEAIAEEKKVSPEVKPQIKPMEDN